MHDIVKKHADNGDVKSLKYVFVDALDVDPTFEKYREDFDYCKKLGLFEPHRELTARRGSSDWDKEYWRNLKNDLLENFSEERLRHMTEVARVFYADKVKRIEQEKKVAEPPKAAPVPEHPESSAPPTIKKTASSINYEEQKKKEAEERQRLEAEIAESNRQAEAEQARQRQTVSSRTIPPRRSIPVKKAKGTVPMAAIVGTGVLAIILLLILLSL